MKEDDLDYHLEDPSDLDKEIKKPYKKSKLIFPILIGIIIFLIGCTILCIIKVINIKNDDDDDDIPDDDESIPLEPVKNDLDEIEPENENSLSFEYYCEKKVNISYLNDDNIIINTFKKGGDNYIEEIGNVNDGFDYEKDESVNIYDLYIPYSASKRKDKYNKIILFIHGGSWINGKKEDMDSFCKKYVKYGFITATMGFNLLQRGSTNHSIFRILDEISATILSIKNYLKIKGFNENKLEIALGGYSSGAHISLLYAYYFQDNPIPIKFVINFCGPVTLELEYWFQIKDINETLENIGQKNIDKIINENKIKGVEKYNNGSTAILLMNGFIGNKYKESEFNEFLDEKYNINKDSEKYKDLFNMVKYLLPVYLVNKNTIPTLCAYSGKDETIGIGHYAYLKSKFEENKNNNISLVYSRYASHNFFKLKKRNDVESMEEMHFQILNFSKLYFSSN